MADHTHEIRTDLDVIAALCELDVDDVIPVHGVALIEVILPDGTKGRQWRIGGEPTIDQTVALLEMIKLDVHLDSRSETDED